MTLRMMRIWLGLLLIAALSEPLRSAFEGGDGYRQGDWLIHNAAHWVRLGGGRRGLIGDAILALADGLRVSPLWPLTLGQLALTGTVFWGMGRLFWVQRAGEARALALLLASPALILGFWIADPSALFRKEVIGLTALLLAALGGNRAIGGALLALGMFGHEVNVLLLPAYLALRQNRLIPRLDAEAMLLGLIALAASAYTLAFMRTDPEPICAALIGRGLSPEICAENSAIRWLALGRAEASAGLQKIISSSAGPAQIAVSLVMGAQYLFLLSRLQPLRRALTEAPLFLVPLLPLFVVAVDWGRWIVLWLTCYALFVLARRAKTQPLPPITPVSARVFWALMAVNLFWGQRHTIGAAEGGAVKMLLEALGVL